MCATCPVVDACLSWALIEGVDFGILGGMTQNQRNKVHFVIKNKKRQEADGGNREEDSE